MKKEEVFGKARFVRPNEKCVSPIFFAEFTADASEKTEITVAGLGFYILFVNGKRVGDDVFAPVTSNYHDYDSFCKKTFGEKMKSRIYADKKDISDYVCGGKNILTVCVGPGWYGMYSDDCVLCYRLTNGKNEFLSGKSVKWIDGPVTEYNFTHGEKQDHTKHDYEKLLREPESAAWRDCEEADIPETEYYISDCPNDKVIRAVEPKKIGETDEYELYDAGENFSGRCVFTCRERAKKIGITVSEEKDDTGLKEKWIHHQTAEFICDGSEKEYGLLFTWHAFRYFTVTKGAENIRCEVIHGDIGVNAAFKSENEVLNWYFDSYIRTQLANMHAGIPSDCPHIERRGYTGDGQLTAETAMLTFDSEKFYRKWMEDIADSQDEISGHIQYTAPYVRSGGGPGGWGCAIAEVPYVFYKTFGDIKPFAKYFDSMLRYLDYLEAHSENGLITSDQSGEWCLGDWCTPHEIHGARPEIPEPFVNGIFQLRTLDRMIGLCPMIGRADEKERLISVRSEKAKVLTEKYYDEKTGDFAGNRNSANAFALAVGLGDERTLQNLVDHIGNGKIDTGIFGTDFVIKVLCENGYREEAVEILSRREYPSFGYMMENGATTLWEEWQDPRSMSHPMFGSAVKYLISHVLGIRRAENAVGFDEVIIEPFTNGVTGSVSGHIDTKNGRISVSVDSKNNVLTVSVPSGVKADIRFGGKIIRSEI